jgi:cobyrinic acid a,c-diamide synthase
MRSAIRSWVLGSRPLYAECGGFMYLGERIQNERGRYEMCGALPIETRMLPRRAALGYREARLAMACVLGPEGTVIRGHEFHYSIVTEARDDGGACYNVMGEQGPEVSSAMLKGTVAGYAHLHFGSNPQAAENMVMFIRKAGR